MCFRGVMFFPNISNAGRISLAKQKLPWSMGIAYNQSHSMRCVTKSPFGMLNPVVRPFCISMFSRCYWFFDLKLLFNKRNILDVISGCSLGVGDQRILCLLHRILQLSAIAYDYFSFFSQYSLVTLHLSPATKILIENPFIWFWF